MLTKKTAILCTAAAIAAIAPFAASSDAEARRGRGGIPYYERFQTNGPERGYEGFAGIGPYSRYCSYRREPKTRCYVTRSGRERCRVVSWSLIQHCY